MTDLIKALRSLAESDIVSPHHQAVAEDAIAAITKLREELRILNAACGALSRNCTEETARCAALLKRNEEHEQFRHQHRDCDAMSAENQRLRSQAVDDRRLAAAIAHRACCGSEHDPANGKLHGSCVVCGVPWPCKTAEYFMYELLPMSRPSPLVRPEQDERDLARYKRLRILGCAPMWHPSLVRGTVIRFQTLDTFLDVDLANHPNRGEGKGVQRE